MMRFLLWVGLICGLTDVSRAETTPDFARDVVPALTKLGCNGGACHGAFSGRGGFRLSLWGFDPAADYRSIVLEARGRRIRTSAPGSSLLLQKPTMVLPHGGGRRLSDDSEAYRILTDWLGQGAPAPVANSPQVIRLEVFPTTIQALDETAVPLNVHAVWSDGLRRDVTRWALFSGNADHIASVSSAGLVQAHAAGRATINVSFQGQVAAVPVTRRFPSTGESSAGLAAFPRDQLIDRYVAQEWEKLGLEPARLTSDTEFLRRVSLDLIGVLPTPEEIRTFTTASSPNKRAEWIDALLERPEYADFWTLKWSDLLRIHRRSLGEKGLASFNGWLRDALRTNRPLHQITTELLTAQGNLYTSGPVAYYFVDRTPAELAETTAQVFLGVRMQCAKCHHHPFEVWSQDDYYGLASFFSRIERKDTREGGRFGGAQAVKLAASGTLTHPDTGAVVAPRLLNSGQQVPPGTTDERIVLAKWLTAADNPFFAKNIVNRYWGALFGRGLIHPIDDLRASNPASHPELLDELAKDFAAHHFDLKYLLRTLCRSRSYQLAADWKPGRDQDGMFFTHRVPRRVSAEVLLDAVNQAAGTHETFASFPIGTRAISLPDPAVPSTFLDTFGRPLRTTPCECARSNNADLRQVLHLSNGQTLHDKVCAGSGRVATLLAKNVADPQLIEELYLATVSRFPTEEEQAIAVRHLTAAPNRKEGVEDLLWTLMNMAEFSYNH